MSVRAKEHGGHSWQVVPGSSEPESSEFIAIAAILMSTVALSIDIMLPALGDIALSFAVDSGNDRQLTIICLFAGLMIGQLLFAPLSDATGRRIMIIVGIVVFTAGCLLCITAESYHGFLAGRALQGFGAAGPRVVTIAMIRDRFAGAKMARIMSFIMGIFILVPVLAPGIGQLLLYLMPWRGHFMILSAVSLIGGSWLILRQPETLRSENKRPINTVFSGITTILSDANAMRWMLACGCCYGALMGYINSSQQLFQDYYQVGNRYTVLFGMSAAFISAASLLNARLVKIYPMEAICKSAIAVLLVWTLVFEIWFVTVDHQPDLWVFLLFNAAPLFLLGLTFGNFNAIALKDLGSVAGLASAVIATISTAVGLCLASVIGLAFNDSVGPIVIGYLVTGLASLALMKYR